MTHLFVYGTLKSSFRNRFARQLAREATLLGRARMPGRLYRVRWYPGLRPPGGPHDFVIGEVYRLRIPIRTLAAMDAYENKDYRREERMAVLGNGETVKCWVYVWRLRMGESRKIQSGEWTRIISGAR